MKQFSILFLLAIISTHLMGQVHWTKYPDNPVMLAGTSDDWDKNQVSPSTVIYQDSMYHMWYWGGDINVHKFQIGYASSPDGINWTKDTLHNPVLKLGPEGAWDDATVSTPSVLFIDSSYHMWYCGTHKTASGTTINKIGHATSTNGVEWTKDTLNNPVLDLGPVGSWDNEIVADPTVKHDGNKFHMWYLGGSGNGLYHLGHATSTDGSNWTKDSLNPVLMKNESWEGRGIEWNIVVYDDTVFHLWYSGGGLGKWVVGYATSPDGINWTKDTRNPIFKGTPGTWNENYINGTAIIDSAHVKYKMWYGGITSAGYSDIGYAESDTRVPYLVVISSKPVYDSTDTIIAEIVLDGTIYMVPEGTSPVVDSMIKYNLASVDALANTEVQIPLTDLSIGQYTVIAVSSDGFVSTNPFPLRVVDNAQPPDVILERDSVDQGNPISAASTKDGTIFLVEEGAALNLTSIFYLFYFVDSSTVIANIPVEFPTAGLSDKDYWLYAVDEYGFISEADTISVTLKVGVEENKSEWINIYPIPARELIFIQTNRIDHYSIHINSINGKLIYSEEMDGTSHQIDLSPFQKGVYFITIRSRDFVTTRKIIKL